MSITKADVSPDLKNAKIWVSVFAGSEEANADTFEAIRENAGFIRHELSQVMRMRTVPFLQFVLDGSMEYGSHMDEVFAKLHKDENK